MATDMLIVLVLAAAAAVYALEQAPLNPQRNGQCKSIRIRKEYRDMTQAEWASFSKALSLIEPETARWTRLHLEHVGEAHGVASFFPWHRMFVVAWEERLRELVPDVTVPYWDWTSDWSDPLSASIFKLLPVKAGPSGDCKYRMTVPNRHCLMRNYTVKEFTTFYSYTTIERILTEATNFEGLWKQLEPAPHGIVHAAIGGPGGDMTQMHSPNDPIFWFHHSNLDRMWAQWQSKDWSARSRDYSGTGQRNRKVRLSDALSPFNVTSEDAVDYKRFCYDYQPYSRWSELQRSQSPQRQGRNRQRMRVEAAQGLLPQPLPEEFMMMHGMNVSEVREQEDRMRRAMLEELVGSIEGGQSPSDPSTSTSTSTSSGSALSMPNWFSLTIVCLVALAYSTIY
jgi:tyrosinase